MTQGVSKRKDLMKISKVIFYIKPIPSHPWWECKKQIWRPISPLYVAHCDTCNFFSIDDISGYKSSDHTYN